jgi:hypothetical protein
MSELAQLVVLALGIAALGAATSPPALLVVQLGALALTTWIAARWPSAALLEAAAPIFAAHGAALVLAAHGGVRARCRSLDPCPCPISSDSRASSMSISRPVPVPDLE